MSKKRNQRADRLIKKFLDLSLGDYATQKNLFEQFDSLMEKHFKGFHSTILRQKLKSLVTDAYFFGLRTGIHYVVKEENVKDEKE